MAAVQPYRLEPERAPEENQAPDREDDNDEIRETVRECICCLEEPESENKFTEGIL